MPRRPRPPGRPGPAPITATSYRPAPGLVRIPMASASWVFDGFSSTRPSNMMTTGSVAPAAPACSSRAFPGRAEAG